MMSLKIIVFAAAIGLSCAALHQPLRFRVHGNDGPHWSTSRNIMPRVVGHRGIPAIYPENTMISFVAALEQGADGIESDLHLTADKVLVLIHDNTLDRTTNCTGYIGNYTLAQLASCNANYASVFGNQYGFLPIPTFESVVQLVVQYQAFFVLDLKENALLGQYIRPVVDKYNASSLMAMSCWTFAQVEDAVTYMNASTRQFLNTSAWGLTGQPGSAFYPGQQNGFTLQQSLSLWEDYITLGVRAFSMAAPVTATFVNQAHARLMPVFVWTIDDALTINSMIDIGVDGILTNNVITLLSVIQQRASQALAPPQDDVVTYTPGALAAAIVITAFISTGLAVWATNRRMRKVEQRAQPAYATLLDPSMGNVTR